MVKRSSSQPVSLHGIFAVVTAAVLGIGLAAGRLRAPASVQLTGTPAEIAVEHATPLTLSIRGTDSRMPGIVELSHADGSGVLVSVPDAWELREVRRAAVRDVPSDPPAAGFRRWRLPAGAVLSFEIPEPGRLTVRNPSGIPLLVLHAHVSLLTDTVDEDSVLVTDRPARIW